MSLTPEQLDRVAGVLVGQAVGDALGVPYEFAPPFTGDARMLGGGLGDYAPGEYSDEPRLPSASPRSPRPARTSRRAARWMPSPTGS